MHERVGLFAGHARNRRQRFDGFSDFFIKALGDDVLGVNVHFPAGQPRRQPRVLAALADGERQLVFAHQDFHALADFVQLDAFQLRRLQRLRDKRLDVGRPRNHVHLFVVELADDVFHALAAHADAGADGIYLRVARIDRHLGAETRFARDALDLNRAVVDFRNLQLEQLDDELRVGAGQNDFRPVRAFLHGLDVAADAFADLVFLGRHALAVRQQRLVFAQVQNHIGTLEPPDRSADDFADAILELGEDQRLLRLPDFLHQRLFGELRRDAAKVGGRDFLFDLVTDLRVGGDVCGVENGEVAV